MQQACKMSEKQRGLPAWPLARQDEAVQAPTSQRQSRNSFVSANDRCTQLVQVGIRVDELKLLLNRQLASFCSRSVYCRHLVFAFLHQPKQSIKLFASHALILHGSHPSEEASRICRQTTTAVAGRHPQRVATMESSGRASTSSQNTLQHPPVQHTQGTAHTRHGRGRMRPSTLAPGPCAHTRCRAMARLLEAAQRW